MPLTSMALFRNPFDSEIKTKRRNRDDQGFETAESQSTDSHSLQSTFSARQPVKRRSGTLCSCGPEFDKRIEQLFCSWLVSFENTIHRLEQRIITHLRKIAHYPLSVRPERPIPPSPS